MRWSSPLCFTAAMLCCSAVASAAPVAADCPVVLSGEVTQGASYYHAFGNGLKVVVEAREHGWVLRVLPSASAGQKSVEPDYAAVVTLPFRSVNPLLLTTDYSFRAQDVVGWSPRVFKLVRDAGAYDKAKRIYDSAVNGAAASTQDAATEAALLAASASGRFEILDARLVPGSGDQTAAAALLATHFDVVPHTFAPATAAAGSLGRVEWLRFRLTLGGQRSRWESAACRARPPER